MIQNEAYKKEILIFDTEWSEWQKSRRRVQIEGLINNLDLNRILKPQHLLLL